MKRSVIENRLQKLFETSPVVVWDDPAGEFADNLADLDLPGATVFVDRDGERFELKALVNGLAATDRLLIYRATPEGAVSPATDTSADWLADVMSYAPIFTADAASTQLADLNALDTPEMRAALKQFAPFFKRASGMKRVHELRASFSTPNELALAVITAALGSDTPATADWTLIAFMACAHEQGSVDAQDKLERAGAWGAFCRMTRDYVGFAGDASKEDELSVHVLMSALHAVAPHGLAERDSGACLARGGDCGALGLESDVPAVLAAEHGAPSPLRRPYSSIVEEGVALQVEVPLTVREGRAWLAREVAVHPPRRWALPAGEACDSASARVAVELRDVWFRYERDGADVLRGTTLTVPGGSLFAVVGGNGTGKSTMLRAICGVARPYRGKITVLGRRLKEWKKAELFRGGVALLPQDPLNLMVKKTVRGDLEEMLDGRGLTAEQRVAAVGEVATLTDIVPLLDAHPFDLSGGEVQRAALAKVLLSEPRLLLLDEPTKGLDAFFKDKLARLLRSLTARGTTVLMVSHDVEFCASYADWCALFFDGNVVTTNPPRQFFVLNSFYTTAANRISRGLFENAVTVEEVVELCRS